MPTSPRPAFAPGRVNLIGEHTDYSGGLALPMAIGLGTTATFTPDKASRTIEVRSALFAERALLPLDLVGDPEAVASVEPSWARYAAAVLATVGSKSGGLLEVESDLPISAGLSSSASFELALALALGFEGEARHLATTCQAAEKIAFGSETGPLDQMASAMGQRGKAIRLDCHSLAIEYVDLPAGAELVVVDSGERRAVAETAYSGRRLQCLEAEEVIGPLRLARPGHEAAIEDPLIRRRARHVLSENARVDAFRDALETGDIGLAGALMDESHTSLASDYEVSTPALDSLVTSLRQLPGVHGARLTGAGFGGYVVVLTEPGALFGRLGDRAHWVVEASDGARLL